MDRWAILLPDYGGRSKKGGEGGQLHAVVKSGTISFQRISDLMMRRFFIEAFLKNIINALSTANSSNQALPSERIDLIYKFICTRIKVGRSH
jgi:hypothetical protein